MDVSIIIVNYNTLTLTMQCINSIIFNTKDLIYEIIVVDNASTERCVEVLSSDKRIIFIEAGENLGFGKANNLGAQIAKGEYLFFLNSDTIINNNAIKIFFDFYESNKVKYNLGVIGCCLRNANGGIGQSVIVFPRCYSPLVYSLKKIFKGIISRGENVSPIEKDIMVEGIIGADMFMRRSIFEEVGGFDVDYFLYGEEVELQKRISDKSYNQFLIRNADITHLEGGSNHRFNHMSFFTVYCLIVGRLIYSNKHFGLLERSIYQSLNFITVFIWMLCTKRFSLKEKRLIINLLKNPKNKGLYNITKISY